MLWIRFINKHTYQMVYFDFAVGIETDNTEHTTCYIAMFSVVTYYKASEKWNH